MGGKPQHYSIAGSIGFRRGELFDMLGADFIGGEETQEGCGFCGGFDGGAALGLFALDN
jgi:hypothetical protein